MQNIFSVEGLKNWLEQQDPNKTYRYNNGSGCLLFRYFTDRGVNVYRVSTRFWWDTDGRRHKLPAELDEIARCRTRMEAVTDSTYFTYGDALRACAPPPSARFKQRVRKLFA